LTAFQPVNASVTPLAIEENLSDILEGIRDCIGLSCLKRGRFNTCKQLFKGFGFRERAEVFTFLVEGKGALTTTEGKICLTRFTWAVDNAAHHGNMKTLGGGMLAIKGLETIGHFFGGRANIDTRAPTRWATGYPRTRRTKVTRTEKFDANANLFLNGGRKRDAKGVAEAFFKKARECNATGYGAT
jgi:hypothetical protein